MVLPKITIQEQGKIIVEKQEEGDYLMMFPNGLIAYKANKIDVETAARYYFKKNCIPEKMGIGTIEWRD